MFSFFLNILPDSFLEFIFYSFFFVGVALIVASWFVKFIPFINKYRWPTQVAGILIFGFGCYLLGGLGIERVWRERAEELKAKIAAAEQVSKETNTEIKTVYVDRVKVITKREVVVQEKIREVAAKIDAQCVVDPDAVKLLNQAADTPKKDTK